MFKKGEQKYGGIMVLAVIALVAIAAWQGGLFSMIAGEADESDDIIDAIEAQCSKKPTMTIGPLQANHLPTTSMAAVYARYYVNDGVGVAALDSTTKTVAYGDQIDILYGYGSSADTTYYGQLVSFEVDICDNFDTRVYSTTLEEHKLNRDGTITFKVRPSDAAGDNDEAGSYNETIGTAESGEWDIRLTTADKYGIAAKGGKFMVVAEFNGSIYKESSLTLDGGSPNMAVPGKVAPGAVDNLQYAWEFDACPTGDDRRCDIDLGTLRIEADDGENPTGGSGAQAAGDVSLGDIKLIIVDQNYGIDSLTGVPILGYVDNVGNLLGLRTDDYYMNVD